jgi:hypothetical protein
VSCASCGSDNRNKFRGEIAIHFPGLQDLGKPIVWVFPDILLCLNCGTAEFVIPERELHRLAKREVAKAG